MTLWPRLIAAAYGPLGRRRAQSVIDQIRAHLLPGRVLDLGAGTGHTAALLARMGWPVTMADVPPHAGALGQRLVAHPIAVRLGNAYGVPRVLYDGARLPFPDGTFGTVLLAFVLHHCPDPAAVLKEAARVSDSRVLVLEDGDGEDTPPGRLERITDSLINLEFGHPHTERSRRQWLELFAECGLGVAHEQPFTSRFGGLAGRHRLYVLNCVR